MIERMIGIVKYRTIARHFRAFTIGECFGFSVGAHDVGHIHRESADARASQHRQMASQPEFLT